MSKCGHGLVNAFPEKCPWCIIDRLTKERDEAIAKDRQPHPTRATYEKVCEINARLTSENGVFIKSCQMHTDLAALEKERDEWKRSSELVTRVLIDTKSDLAAAMKVVEAWGMVAAAAGLTPDDFECKCDPPSYSDKLIINLREAIAGMMDKPNPPKGRFLPDIEDLSHMIDFEELKCGTCDESGEVETVRGKHHKLIGSKPCPDCGGKEQ